MTSSNDPGNSTAWHQLALDLREALDKMSVPVDPCGPGEADDCGNSFATHCVSYFAAIQAKAEHGLRHMHHGDPEGAALAQQQVEHWRAVFAGEDDH